MQKETPWQAIGISRVEDLKGLAKKIAQEQNIEKGLVAVFSVVDESGFRAKVEQVKGSPTEYLREVAAREGINLNKLARDAYQSQPQLLL